MIRILQFTIIFILVTNAPACAIFNKQANPTPDLILPGTRSLQTPDGTPDPLSSTSSPVISTTSQPSDSEVAETVSTSSIPVELLGLKVVYTINGNIWLSEDGRKIQLTDSGLDYTPIISSDGNLIAFLRQVDRIHNELWVIKMDGSDLKRLVSLDDLNKIGGGVLDPNAIAVAPYRYEWIPNTHMLAFNTQQVFPAPGFALLDDLNTVNADTLELKFPLLAGWGGNFTFSPDGYQVAITTQDAIFLMDSNGDNYRPVLTYDPVITYSEVRYYAAPVWSPDGSYLRVAIPPVEPLAETNPLTEIWRISADGEQVIKESEFTTTAFLVDPYDRSLVFSPNMNYIIYLIDVDPPVENKQQLWLAAANGENARLNLEDRLLQIETWSTDSQFFLFTKGEDQQAWLGHIDGTAQPFPNEPFGMMRANWIDDQHLIYIQPYIDRFDLILADMQGNITILDSITGAPPAYDFYSQK